MSTNQPSVFTAIIFDLGGVLFTNGTKKFTANLSTKYGIPYDRVYELMDGPLGSKYRESHITTYEFWTEFKRQLPMVTEEITELNNAWIDGYELIEGTRDIIQTLAAHYDVYYLSDNVKERVDRINDRYHFLSWFKDGIFSYDVGMRKPSLEIYRLMLQRANVEAHQALFIDDKEDALAPARELGMSTVLFTTPEALKDALQRLSLAI